MSARIIIEVSSDDSDTDKSIKPKGERSPEVRKAAAMERIARELLRRDYTKPADPNMLRSMMDERLKHVGTRSSAAARVKSSFEADDSKSTDTEIVISISAAAAPPSPPSSSYSGTAAGTSDIKTVVSPFSMLDEAPFAATPPATPSASDSSSDADVLSAASALVLPSSKRKRASNPSSHAEQAPLPIESLLPKPVFALDHQITKARGRKRIRTVDKKDMDPEVSDSDSDENPFNERGSLYQQHLLGVTPRLEKLMSGVSIMEGHFGVRVVIVAKAQAPSPERCESPPTYEVNYNDYNSE